MQSTLAVWKSAFGSAAWIWRRRTKWRWCGAQPQLRTRCLHPLLVALSRPFFPIPFTLQLQDSISTRLRALEREARESQRESEAAGLSTKAIASFSDELRRVQQVRDLQQQQQ